MDSIEMGEHQPRNQSYDHYPHGVQLDDVQLEDKAPFPTKLLVISLSMFAIGCILIFSGFISEIFSVDDPTRGIACWVLGAITFVPGSYYSYLFYRAYKTKSPEERMRIMRELEAVANCPSS